AAAAPMTRKPPACRTSWRTEAQNAAHLVSPSIWDRSGNLIHSRRPNASQSQPITHAVIRLATARATTISGFLGKATAVAVGTIGLIAGEASRNASAAAGVMPRRTSAPATGTEAHSQPGRTTPAVPATGTARAGWRGKALAKNDAGTKTAMTAESTTPNTRN